MASQIIDPTSQLFIVRVWLEPVGSGQSEVRYQVTHVLSRERRYFRDVSMLLSFLQGKLNGMDETDVSHRDEM